MSKYHYIDKRTRIYFDKEKQVYRMYRSYPFLCFSGWVEVSYVYKNVEPHCDVTLAYLIERLVSMEEALRLDMIREINKNTPIWDKNKND